MGGHALPIVVMSLNDGKHEPGRLKMSSFATPIAFGLSVFHEDHVVESRFVVSSHKMAPFPVADTARSRREEHAFVP